MGTIQKKNWMIDGVLFVGFLLGMCLDLTGVKIHEWLGLAVIVLAGYHLVVHRRWFVALSRQIFGGVKGQARNWYVVDIAMMVGFIVILVTGLVDSTWLNLKLSNYLEWRDVHIYASLITIALLVFKMGLHWRWIALTSKRVFTAAPQAPEVGRAAGPTPRTGIGRREFLGIMGAVSFTAVVASSTAISTLIEANSSGSGADSKSAAGTASKSTSTATTATSASSSSAAKNQATSSSATQSKTTTTTMAATTPAKAATQSNANSQTANNSIGTCVEACPKRCSYPGRCRRYADTNGNNRCDLGECAA